MISNRRYGFRKDIVWESHFVAGVKMGKVACWRDRVVEIPKEDLKYANAPLAESFIFDPRVFVMTVEK